MTHSTLTFGVPTHRLVLATGTIQHAMTLRWVAPTAQHRQIHVHHSGADGASRIITLGIQITFTAIFATLTTPLATRTTPMSPIWHPG